MYFDYQKIIYFCINSEKCWGILNFKYVSLFPTNMVILRNREVPALPALQESQSDQSWRHNRRRLPQVQIDSIPSTPEPITLSDNNDSEHEGQSVIFCATIHTHQHCHISIQYRKWNVNFSTWKPLHLVSPTMTEQTLQFKPTHLMKTQMLSTSSPHQSPRVRVI